MAGKKQRKHVPYAHSYKSLYIAYLYCILNYSNLLRQSFLRLSSGSAPVVRLNLAHGSKYRVNVSGALIERPGHEIVKST